MLGGIPYHSSATSAPEDLYDAATHLNPDQRRSSVDLTKAIEAHVQWKTKFRVAIQKQESMDVNTISRDDCCEIGKWLHGDGKKHHGTLTSFQEVVREHAKFHRIAGGIASAINAKRFVEAEQMIANGTEFVNQSSAVSMALTRLKRDAQL